MYVKVLIADDNEAMHRGIVTFLIKQRPDWELFTVSNGEQAIQAMKSFVPNVALLDIRMPILSGLEVASQIIDSGLSTKIILLTADDGATFTVEGVASQGAVFIDKAYIVRDLLPAVDRLLTVDAVALVGNTGA